MKCDYEYEIREGNIFHKKGCPVCANKIVVKGINDIGTTHPHIVKHFLDQEIAYTHSHGSNKSADFICDKCGSIQKNKSINYALNRGFRCHECMDGITKPNKIMRKVLELLGIDYETERQFYWSERKKYDFYIEEHSMIIEMQGQQHTTNFFINNSNDIENDKIKKKNALQNGIKKYICIDSFYPDFDYIINEIFDSELNEIFDIKNKLNLIECRSSYDDSYLIKACDIWNKKKPITTIEIGKKLKLSQAAVHIYLKKGVKLGLCDYDPNVNWSNKKSRNIICVNTRVVYESAKKAAEAYNLKSSNGIRDCCNGKRKTYGIDENGDDLVWEYVA